MKPQNTSDQQDTQDDLTILIHHDTKNNNSANDSQDSANQPQASMPVQAPEPAQSVVAQNSTYPWTGSANDSQDSANQPQASMPVQQIDEPIIIHPTVLAYNPQINEPQPTQSSSAVSSPIVASPQEDDSDLYDETDESSHKIANTVMIIALIIAIFFAANLKYHYYVF